MRNHKLGFVEDAAIDSFVFDEQYNTFHKYGYAADPSASAGNNYIGDLDVLEKNNGISVYNIPQHEQKKRKIEKKTEAAEEDDDGMDKEEAENPATDAWLMKNRKSPWAGKKEGLQSELTEEQKKYAEEHARKKEEKAGGEKGELVADKTTFHGKEERDYQGRYGLRPRKMLKLVMIIVIYPRDWCIHGVAILREFLL
ncbi:PRE-MRNA-PROCESSING FACTOR 17 [Salix viminalis]|uniref:PRE-MRNA-PROCESSING FACTOR 17 n=1 Tax=Salix viminalis TaxID=40686 RepID=A0A9Q0U1J2_SALVM|nr:PRE-MRNA-PROCESSING FACTOR 17 [Salix viminalis]